MVKNDVTVLTYGCDLRPDHLLDILNTSGLVELPPTTLKFLLVADGKDDKLIALNNHFKITYHNSSFVLLIYLNNIYRNLFEQ